MSVDRAELTIGDGANTATALYYIDITGGSRWDYTDQALVFQALVKENGKWVIVHQIDAWALDEGSSSKKRVFEFDYIYPVSNLDRALAFYRPILGDPETLTADRAIFNLTGPRFILDASSLGGLGVLAQKCPVDMQRSLFQMRPPSETAWPALVSLLLMGPPKH